ncbi:caspase-3-like isoform X1 [Littorina saxatilis]|uniref:caspase-3-like isoform X1 n=1 Tax=Littorina saxatilis TaxID=31220 RepID=UPI0038B47369
MQHISFATKGEGFGSFLFGGTELSASCKGTEQTAMGVFEVIMVVLLEVLKLSVVNTLILGVFWCLASGSGSAGNDRKRRTRVKLIKSNQGAIPVDTEETCGLDTPDAGGKYQSRQPAFPRPSERRQSLPGIKYSVNVSDCYNMNHTKRGQAIIINNKHFDPDLEMGTRKGTEIDAQNLDNMLSGMGFTSSIKDDCTAKNMTDIISEVAQQNHADEDCFVLVILTHGEPDRVYATDYLVNVDDLLTPLKTCPSLAGKPKIIIIQACRGEKLDEGTDVVDAKGGGEDDMDPVVYRVPVEADFLMAFACVPGYFAWRNEEQGSWFVQALVEVLRENWARMDLLTMMTRVCKKVALDFESTKTSNRKFLHKKQVPCISSMLTRDVYFPPMTDQQ